MHVVLDMFPSVDCTLRLMMKATRLGLPSLRFHYAKKLKLQLPALSTTAKLVQLMQQQRFIYFFLLNFFGAFTMFHVFTWRWFQMQIRYLDTRRASNDEVKKFEYKLLGEVRMMNALRKHRSIVDIYGHQLSSKWVQDDSDKEYRIMQSVILMEYVKGGSLKVNSFVHHYEPSCIR